MADITYTVYIDWDNDGSVLSGSYESGEDVSARVLGVRTALNWSYGRDVARSLSACKPGQVTIQLNNVSKDYSPDNASSPLYGNLGPGKPVLIKAVHSAVTYNLFWGFIDDYSIDPTPGVRSVTLTVIDALGRLAATSVTTPLYQSVQPGEAINAILDGAGWPTTLRDIDTGATTLRYWWLDSANAWDSIQDIVASEGPSALAYVNPSGNFVFRDRHHRYLDAASTSSQATLSDTGSEPLFSEPVEYNIGFRDLINSVDFKVEERGPTQVVTVWSSDSTYVIPSGQTINILATTDEPFFGAFTPDPDIPDYVLLSGSVNISLSATSGQTTQIQIFANSTSYITGMALRAYSVPVAREFTVNATSPASISKYGIATPETDSAPNLAGINDAQAIAEVYVAQRSERLPVMSITVKGANDTRKVQMLTRTMSDMVTIVEAQTSTNNTHYIERVEHNIDQVGKIHSTTFGCERTRASGTQFTFDLAGAGFNDGTFGVSGFDSPSTIFILDSNVAGHRLDSGKLAT